VANYPDCEYLGNDAAELTTFALTLRLIGKLTREGHTHQCARAMVATDARCSCDKGPPSNG
jgi:hypothetical protein